MNTKTALLNGSQAAEADRLSIAFGISGIELMRKAGKAVAYEIMNRWSQRPVVVLCGPGNNGGDGFVAAEQLSEAGWDVRIGLLCTKECLTGDARHYADKWLKTIEPLAPDVLAGAELIVDAVFGAGLSRAVEGLARETLIAADKIGCPIIAVDVPSGIMGDTGENMGAIKADITITFFRKKPGHLLLPGKYLCGDVIVADIGIPPSVLNTIEPNTFENSPELWLDALPKPQGDGNKYTRGHALLYGGYPVTGAARLAAHAAARIGAGLTTIAVHQVGFPIYATALTSVMVKPLNIPGDFNVLLDDKRFSAFLIGPGAGRDNEVRIMVLAMLGAGRPVILDADAISMFQDDVAALKKAIIYPCIMTPHEGEFERLYTLEGDKLTRARAAAKDSGAIIVLKGADTVISSPDGRAIINANGPPTLATAGAGDVLSGLILGLVTQGMDPFLAAAAAVWLHGAAAEAFGPCLIAEDIAEMLNYVFKHLRPETVHD
jgi:hydroxyethylthiazole kinase-like uncharacterized protein yjeF